MSSLIQLLLLDVEERLASLGGAGRRDADPVLVRDRLEDLLDQEPVGALELREDGVGIAQSGGHARDRTRVPWAR